MTNDNVNPNWMDERDPETRPNLVCHVELSIETGDTFREQHAKAAWALRTIALQLEEGKFEDGFFPITTLEGEKLGELYLSYDGILKP
jgi:hypothetical protein